MGRDFGRADRLRIAREKRDEEARVAHEAAVAAAPHERRVLVRARDGELVSYTREEYGVGKTGHGPTIQTWQGYAAGSVVLLGLFLFFVVVVARDYADAPPDPAWWYLPTISVVTLPVLALFVHSLRKERRADRLRRARGLPRPIQ